MSAKKSRRYRGRAKTKFKSSKDEPKVVFSKWDGEVSLGVKYAKVKGAGEPNGDKIEWKDEKEEVHAYPLPAGEGMEDGGFEIEVVLKEKPNTNKFDFEIVGTRCQPFFTNQNFHRIKQRKAHRNRSTSKVPMRFITKLKRIIESEA